MKHIAASLAIVAAATPAYALDLDLEFAGEMYLIGSVGRTTISQDTYINTLSSTSTTSGNTITSMSPNQTDRETSRTGYKLQLGYEFSPFFAIEGGYIDLGKTTDSTSYATKVAYYPFGTTVNFHLDSDGQGGSLRRTKSISGWNIAGVGIYPVNKQLSLFGKLGLIDAKVKYSATATGPFATTFASTDTVESNWKGYYGVGAAFFPNADNDLGIRFEYERFSKIGDINASGTTDVNLMSLGISSKF